ncbi:MAG: alpha/beta fold hydrolase [Paracoccaceae bacterium]
MELNVIEHASDSAEVHPPLIIAHGLFGAARNFNTLGRKLAVGRRVVLVDMPNHGESPWTDDVSYPAMAAALGHLVETRCGGRAVVLGHSMGGKAAMALALSRSDLLAGLIVADIAPVAYSHTHQPYIEAMLDMDLSKVTKRSDGDTMLADVVAEPMLRAFLLQNLLVEDGMARWKLNLKALRDEMPALIGWPEEMAAALFDGAAFFIYGGASEYMGSDQKAAVQAQFPAAEFHEIPGAGHWLHAEQPGAFLSSVQKWLARANL